MTMTTREVLETAAAYIKEAIDQLPADSPEVPDRIEKWPYEDEHLRRDFWKEPNGDVWGWEPSKLVWQMWSHEHREWAVMASSLAWMSCTFTRTVDPSLPRRFDSLADIPEDMGRAVGKYRGYLCELARSPLSGTGWMMRVDAPYVRQQWVEYMDLDEDDLTDIEEAIDHE